MNGQFCAHISLTLLPFITEISNVLAMIAHHALCQMNRLLPREVYRPAILPTCTYFSIFTDVLTAPVVDILRT